MQACKSGQTEHAISSLHACVPFNIHKNLRERDAEDEGNDEDEPVEVEAVQQELADVAAVAVHAEIVWTIAQ